MSDSIYVSFGAKAPQSLGPWIHGRSGVFGELYQRVERAGNILNNFERKRQQIRSDQRLSAKAKLEDERAAAKEAADQLRTSRSLLRSIAERLADEQRSVVAVEPYKPNDVATVLIDLALGEHIKGMDQAKLVRSYRLGDGDPRLLEAMVRLPTALTGLTPEQHQACVTQAIYQKDPANAQVREAYAEALQMAEYAYKKAGQLLMQESGEYLEPEAPRHERVSELERRMAEDDEGALAEPATDKDEDREAA